MDRISKLPDEVICHILSFLPTKHAGATSILSPRWRYLWTFVPVIDLDDSLYLNSSRQGSDPMLFNNFIDRILSLNQSQTIAKFRLRLHDCCGLTLSRINGFIQNVFLRNVVQVHLGIFSKLYDDAGGDNDSCLKIPHSQSLRVLKVTTENFLKLPVFPGCFPRLRVFDVDASLERDDEWITNLFPCLPALEKLHLVADLCLCVGKFNFNIGGAALKHLELDLSICVYSKCDAMVVIDAPQLEYLRLKDGFLASYLVKNKPAISEVRLEVGDYDRVFLKFLGVVGPTRLTRFSELLHCLVNTKFISVSASTLKVIFSQKWNLPVLPYLKKLELEVPASSWLLLLHWLQSCPNLKVLSLIIKEEKHEEEFEEVKTTVPDVVPSCLSSSIKEIEIKRLRKVDEEEILKYLLYNATDLHKFTVDSRVYVKDGILF